MRLTPPAAVLAAVLALPVAAPVQAGERPRVAVTVVTLDNLRQLQAEYGRSSLDSLGDARWGRFDWAPPALEPALFRSCVGDRMDHGLDYCIRYYLTRADLPADTPPTVVVAFDDGPGATDHRLGGETLRVSCFGRGVTPADAAAQDTWMWPRAARMHGMRDMERDSDALAACISAAASERWNGLRQPDPSP
ncbi:hypothetical protein [Brevundimonas sp.]|uniref:hypothetical protein n=1 Tax=Brevundimonas sp. TaxID=1871086 RepID=UPI002FC6C20E